MVQSVMFSYDDMQISVHIWDVKTGQQVRELSGHTDTVCSVMFSPCSPHIIWDANTGKELKKFDLHASVISVAFSVNGLKLVSGLDDSLIQIWNATTWELLHSLTGHTDAVSSVMFSHDGTWIISTLDDHSIRNQPVALKGHTNAVKFVAFSLDNKHFVSIWDGTTACFAELQNNGDYVACLSFSLDREQLQILKDNTNSAITSVVFFPDNIRFVSGSEDGPVMTWNEEIAKVLKGHRKGKVLHGHTSSVRSVAFSPDGTRIVSGSWDKSTGIGAILLDLRV
ncbi:WD40-repeat-containing domain protein [Mucidula mucida]|nr:WD40-repeat-containing domain protein [Mucidula mucida]